MAADSRDAPLRPLRRYVRQCADSEELTDRQLLQRFANDRDEMSFALLFERHGPMIHRLSRRMLETAPADDVLQATFLVLARKAASMSWQDSIAGWLYEVAYRIVRKEKSRLARRRLAETQAARAPNAETVPKDDNRETHETVQEEVAKLPEKYRSPVVLCYFEGKTNEQAARQLGCPIGTIFTRLNRAREILRRRLERRGFQYTGAALAAVLTSESAAIVFAEELVQQTTQAAVAIASGAVPAEISTSVLTLMKAYRHSVVSRNMGKGLVLLCMVGLTLVGALLLTVLNPGNISSPTAKTKVRPTGPVPVVTIVAEHPVEIATWMEKEIAIPMEKALRQIKSAKQIDTWCFDGRCVLRVTFDDQTKLDVARKQIARGLDKMKALPPEMEDFPKVIPVDAVSAPVGLLVSEKRDGAKTDANPSTKQNIRDWLAGTRVAKQVIRPMLENVPDLVTPIVVGAPPERISVCVDPEKLLACGLTVRDVRRSLVQDDSPNEPWFEIKRYRVRTIHKHASRKKLEAFLRELVIKNVKTGATVPLSRVGTVKTELSPSGLIVRLNGRHQVICLPIYGASGVEHKKAMTTVQKLLPKLNAKLPTGFHLAFVPLNSPSAKEAGDMLAIQLRVPANTRLERVDEVVRRVEQTIENTIPVDARILIYSETGFQSNLSRSFSLHSDTAVATVYVKITPNQRKSAQQFARILRQRLTNLPGVELFVSAGRGNRPPLVIQVAAESRDVRIELANSVKQLLSMVDGVSDVQLAGDRDTSAVSIIFDRQMLSQLHLTTEEASKQIHGERVIQFEDISVDLVLENVGRKGKKTNVPDYPLLANGRLVPLKHIAECKWTTNVSEIRRVDGKQIVEVQVDIDGRNVDAVAADINKRLQQIRLPAGANIKVKRLTVR